MEERLTERISPSSSRACPTPAPTVAGLENVPSKPRRRDRLDRSVRGSDGLIPAAIRVTGPPTRSEAHPVARRHCACRMDRPARSRRHVVGRARHTISSVIGTGSTERHLRAASERWAFATDRQRRDHHGENGHAERLIGSIRRECLDHVIVSGERHLRHVLRSYARYYNSVRTHLSLAKDSPQPPAVQAVGGILPLPVVGGLHHHYVRI